MAGMLTFKELQAAVGKGEIDTVVIAFPDMQGRLIGKRMQAEYFLDSAHEETHGCDYLLANDIDMEPVPGYTAANWEKGYGDFVMKPDMTTLRRIPWLPGTALVLADILDHHDHEDVAHAPRGMLKKQIARRARPLHVISVNYPDSPLRFAATTEDAATHFAAMEAIGLRSIKITQL